MLNDCDETYLENQFTDMLASMREARRFVAFNQITFAIRRGDMESINGLLPLRRAAILAEVQVVLGLEFSDRESGDAGGLCRDVAG
jgi:hypothetical protein